MGDGARKWVCLTCEVGVIGHVGDHLRSGDHVAAARRKGWCPECGTNGKHGPGCSVGAKECESAIPSDTSLRCPTWGEIGASVFAQKGGTAAGRLDLANQLVSVGGIDPARAMEIATREEALAEPCRLCGGHIDPDLTGRPTCYGCGPGAMVPAEELRRIEERRPGHAQRALRTIGEDLRKERLFGEALDRAMPPSMAPRPGERCKVCGEAVPMTARDYMRQSDTGGPNYAGWMRLAYPVPHGYETGIAMETVGLCPCCGKRVAEYISYCAAHPHARDGQ